MSPRRFDGWEPAVTTVYEYDGAGRLVRATTTREPEWSDRDRAEALALHEYRSTRCPGGCGQDVRDSTALEDAPGTPEWDVPPPRRCAACDALASAQRAAKENPNQNALLWRVEKKPPGAAG